MSGKLSSCEKQSRLLARQDARLRAFVTNIERGSLTECWPWKGRVNACGYGQCKWRQRSSLAHRLVYQEFVGPIPAGLNVLHVCDNPPCCNPAHLWLGTQEDNNKDCAAKGRSARGERAGNTVLIEEEVWAIKNSDVRPCVLAKQHGVAPSTITEIQRGHTWTHVNGPVRTGNQRVLTAAVVAAIRESDKTSRALAEEYCVSESTVGRARNYKTWK